MLRRLRRGRWARGFGQEHGARRSGARERAQDALGVAGLRAASHGRASWWPVAPRPPATSPALSAPAPQQRGGGGELGRGEEPREGSA